MGERYEFGAMDHVFLRAAEKLLEKVAAAPATTSAQLLRVAKLLHVFTLLPDVTTEVDVRVEVVSPRRNFGEIETVHWWRVAAEGVRLSIASGGHFYRASTGGDSFSTMSWEAIPEEDSQLEDHSDSLWMVPDLQSFPDGIAGIEFTSGGYTVEISDEGNPALEVEEGESVVKWEDEQSEAEEGRDTTEPTGSDGHIESRSVVDELLDCISALSLFVAEIRADGSNEKALIPLIADLEDLFRKADERGEDLFLLGALVPDLLYIRISELEVFDRWTRMYAATVPHFLLDQLRVRGVCSFYILDNSIREDRFDALVKIFSGAGYSVISPSLGAVGEAEVLDQIDRAQVLRRHILYVERDASVDHLAAVRGLEKASWYTVAFRNQAPTEGSMEILRLAAGSWGK